MKNSSYFLTFLMLFCSFLNYSQQSQNKVKFKVEGKVVEKSTNLPLEYATITLVNSKNPKAIFGGITDSKGEFNVDVVEGTYNIKIEFISFKPIEIKDKSITN